MKNSRTFREKKIQFFYNFYLEKDQDKELLQERLIKDKYFSFPIQSIQKIELIILQLDFLETKAQTQMFEEQWNKLLSMEKSTLINALYEIEFLKKSKKIIINEYVNFSKKYGSTDQSFKLINAVLDKI